LTLTKEIRIAILGIVAVTLFVLGYKYLKGNGLFSSTRVLLAEYDNVQGLTPSSYVQLKGFNIGSVKSIELSKEHPGKVLVTMNVDKDIQLPADTRASIISTDLLGTKAINLLAGQSTTFLSDKEYIAGTVELGTIENLGASATPAIDSAKTTISSLHQTITGINQILDAGTKENLRNTLKDLGETMHSFNQFAAELNAQRGKISALLANLESFTGTLKQNNGKVTQILANAETTTAHLKDLDMDGTLRELKETMQELQNTLTKINQGNGSMALLMNDDKLYRNLKNTLSTANDLLADINARPSRYINVNIFGKKQKNDCPPPLAPNANQ